MKKYWIALFSSVGLIGCSASVPTQNSLEESLSQSVVCCESLAEFSWVSLESDDKLKSEINSSSPVWNFGSNRSYFSSFKFNKRSGNVNLVVRSFMEQGKVLKPYVALLDDEYRIVRTVPVSDFTVKYADALNRNRYELHLSIDAKKTPYFIIYGESVSLGQKVVVPHPAKLRAQRAGEPLPIISDPTFYVSMNGFIEVEVETLSVSAIHSFDSEQIEPPIYRQQVIGETQTYYYSAIKKAVESDDIPKALSLLEEAKVLGIEGAQEVFVKAVNSK